MFLFVALAGKAPPSMEVFIFDLRRSPTKKTLAPTSPQVSLPFLSSLKANMTGRLSPCKMALNAIETLHADLLPQRSPVAFFP